MGYEGRCHKKNHPTHKAAFIIKKRGKQGYNDNGVTIIVIWNTYKKTTLRVAFTFLFHTGLATADAYVGVETIK